MEHENEQRKELQAELAIMQRRRIFKEIKGSARRHDSAKKRQRESAETKCSSRPGVENGAHHDCRYLSHLLWMRAKVNPGLSMLLN
jgi:hypothetical protein